MKCCTRIHYVIGLVLCLLSLTSSAFCADVFWTNTAGGDWDVGANWSTGAIPGSGDDVFIVSTGTYTVTLDAANVEINSLTIGALSGTQTLSLINRTLNISSASEISDFGEVRARNATINGTGTLDNHGSFAVLQTVTIDLPFFNQLSGRFAVEGSSSGDAQLRVGGDFENLGEIRMLNSDGGSVRDARLRVLSNEKFINGTGATIDAVTGTVDGTREIVFESSAEFENFGTMNFAVESEIDPASSSDFSNFGTINVTGGNLSINQSSSADMFHSGTINIDLNRRLFIGNGNMEHRGGSYNGDGTLFCQFVDIKGTQPFAPNLLTTLRSATSTAPVEVKVQLDIRNTVTFSAPVTSATSSLVRVLGSIDGDADLTLNSRYDNFGEFALINQAAPQGRTVTLRINNGGQFINSTNATHSFEAGSVDGTRRLTINSGGVFDNYGFVDGNSEMNITVNSGGDFNNFANIVSNLAPLKVVGGGTADFQNAGKISLASGIVSTFNNGRYIQAGGRITGIDQINFEFVTFNGSAEFVNSAPTLFRSCTFNTDFRNNGLMSIHNTVTFNAKFLNRTSATCIVESSTDGDALLRISDQGENQNKIQLTNTDPVFGRTSSIQVDSNKLFINATSGVISILEGTVLGTRRLRTEANSVMRNFGEINNDAAYIISNGSALFDNQGTLQLTTASVEVSQTAVASFTNAGTINTVTGSTFLVVNGKFDYAGGQLSGAGNAHFRFTTLQGTRFESQINTAMRSSTVDLRFHNRDCLTIIGITTFNQRLLNGTNAIVKITGVPAADGGDAILQIADEFKNIGDVQMSGTDLVFPRAAILRAISGGTINNCTNGEISLRQGALGGTRRINISAPAQFQNMGLVSGDVDFSIEVPGGGLFDNRGFLSASSANISINSGNSLANVRNSGLFGITTGNSISLNNGTFDHANGGILGTGLLTITNATFNGPTGFAFEVPVRARTSAFNVTIANMQLMHIERTCTFNDRLFNSTNASIIVEAGSNGAAQLLVNSTFANFGLLILDNVSPGSALSSSVLIDEELVNEATGQIFMRPGTAGGDREIILKTDAAFDNLGDLTPLTSATIVSPASVIRNFGEFKLTAANLTIDQGNFSVFQLAGSVLLPSPQVFMIDGGEVVHDAAVFSGNGRLALQDLTFGGSTYVSIMELFVQDCIIGSTIASHSVLRVRGDNQFNFPVTNDFTGELRIEGTAAEGDGILRAKSSLLNGNDLSLDAQGSNADAMIIMDSNAGFFSSGTTGTIVARRSGSGGECSIELGSSGLLRSEGLLEIETSQTLSISGGTTEITTGATLAGHGTLNSDLTTLRFFGNVSPGSSPGRLSLDGPFVIQSSIATYTAEIGGTTAVVDHDQLEVGGRVTLQGTLDLKYLNGFTPSAGQAFTLMTYTDRVGRFDVITGANLGGGNFLTADYRSDRLVLTLSGETLVDVDVYLQGLWDGQKHKRSAAIVELRSGSTLAASVLSARTSCLMSSGATLRATFNTVTSGDYWVIVRHGGHMAVASATRLTITQDQANNVDFTKTANVVNGSNGMLTVSLGGTNYDVVRTGDFNQDLSVSADDFIQYFIPNFGVVNPGRVPLLD